MDPIRLVPIHNCIINGYSIVENVFGSAFVVYDAMGVMHTTANNVSLLGRAQALIENIQLYDIQGLRAALQQLRDEADVLRQGAFDPDAYLQVQPA